MVTSCPVNRRLFSSLNCVFATKNSSVEILLLKATSAIVSPSFTVYFCCSSVVPNSKYFVRSSSLV